MSSIAKRLSQLGHALPSVEAPAANYLNFSLQDNLLIISGQIGDVDATKAGPVGIGLSAETASRQAQLAALRVLAAIDSAVGGDRERIAQVMRLGVFIAAAPDFAAHSVVANGASDLIVAVLGDRGRHARTSIGVASLPVGAAVEVDAIVLLRDPTAS